MSSCSQTRRRGPTGVLVSLFVLAVAASGCGPSVGAGGSPRDFSTRQIRIVATTSIVADLVGAVGRGRVEVMSLMGPGIDPHLYRASEGDVTRMGDADVIFYNGLHLEGKMVEVFERMTARGMRTQAVTAGIDLTRLMESPAFQGNYDPHVWFDVSLWIGAAGQVQRTLTEMDPAHDATYRKNLDAYVAELRVLHQYVREQAGRVPAPQRVLVTAHDAFGYFGRAYGFEVRGLQGISTVTEAGTGDVQGLAGLIAGRRIPAIFIESSVPPRGIEAVQAAVRARGFEVRIGGHLYSDALGNPGTAEGTYIGTVRHNIDTVVRGLLGEPRRTTS